MSKSCVFFLSMHVCWSSLLKYAFFFIFLKNVFYSSVCLIMFNIDDRVTCHYVFTFHVYKMYKPVLNFEKAGSNCFLGLK